MKYDHDALGRPVRKWRGDPVNGWMFDRLWVYDGDQRLVSLDPGMNRIEEYAYAPGIDRPIATIRGNTGVDAVGYHMQDELGNILGIIENGAYISQTNSYDAWGTPTETGHAYNNQLKWKGLKWEGDVISLYYMRNRWYDYETGRFMSEDPIGLAGGINLYAFANNDPINGRDPYGLLYSCEWFTVYGSGTPTHNGWLPTVTINSFPVCIDTGDPDDKWREFPVGTWDEPGPGRRRGGGGGGPRGTPQSAQPACHATLRNSTNLRLFAGIWSRPRDRERGFLRQTHPGGIETVTFFQGHRLVPGRTITMSTPPILPGTSLIGHTHPVPPEQGGIQRPSPRDSAFAVNWGVPVGVVSRDSLYLVDTTGVTYACGR